MRPHKLIKMLLPVMTACLVCACSAINVGKWKGIEDADSDEKHWLVSKINMSAGSASSPRDVFDHAMHDQVVLMFVPANEKNEYVTKTIWYDPAGIEFRTIRESHNVRTESPDGSERPKEGTTRVHAIPLKDLYEHKPGRWTVELYLDDELARRLEFVVR